MKEEALKKRKVHFLINDYTSGVRVAAPLCGLSPEALIAGYGGLFYTVKRAEMTCKRCIRSIYGSYER